MQIDKIKKNITELLKQRDEVDFAYIFGSAVSGKIRYGSDLDIAVYFNANPDILAIGELAIKLEEAIKQKIDLVKLNDLDKTNPVLAYSVLSSGIPVIINNEVIHKEFKISAILYYLDFDYTRNLLDKAFSKRLSTNTFAVFDK